MLTIMMMIYFVDEGNYLAGEGIIDFSVTLIGMMGRFFKKRCECAVVRTCWCLRSPRVAIRCAQFISYGRCMMLVSGFTNSS